MENENLIWKEEGKQTVYTTPVFTVTERQCRSPLGEEGKYTVLEARDWAIVVPVVKTEKGKAFLMVRQWRHGEQSLSLEFPGGVFEPGESPFEAAKRELTEETGYIPGKLTEMGSFNPNPAIMANHVYFFLAEDLVSTGKQHLDEDEFVGVEIHTREEVLQGIGKPPYFHALMGTALALYLRESRDEADCG
jgi:8-oxo-dGTP pyrophosphatase MutT (NUDIX family)